MSNDAIITRSVRHNGTSVGATKYSQFSLVVKSDEDDPSKYSERSAAGPGGSEVRLPHLSAGAERVTSAEHPLGYIQTGFVHVPVQGNPDAMTPTVSNAGKWKLAEDEARRKRGLSKHASPEDIAKLLDTEPETAEDSSEVEASEPPHSTSTQLSARPDYSMPEEPEFRPASFAPSKPVPRIAIQLHGPHGIFRGKVLEVVEDADQIVCIAGEDDGFLIPPLDEQSLTLVIGPRRLPVASTGVNFTYNGKLFVVFVTKE